MNRAFEGSSHVMLGDRQSTPKVRMSETWHLHYQRTRESGGPKVSLSEGSMGAEASERVWHM